MIQHLHNTSAARVILEVRTSTYVRSQLAHSISIRQRIPFLLVVELLDHLSPWTPAHTSSSPACQIEGRSGVTSLERSCGTLAHEQLALYSGTCGNEYQWDPVRGRLEGNQMFRFLVLWQQPLRTENSIRKDGFRLSFRLTDGESQHSDRLRPWTFVNPGCSSFI